MSNVAMSRASKGAQENLIATIQVDLPLSTIQLFVVTGLLG